MAYNLDYIPGQSEAVTDQEIDAIAISTPTFFEIEPNEPWPFILADVSITNGSTTLILGTDYTLIPNAKYTEREASLSGKTIYSGLTIINATYAGIPLYVTALNFGTYTSNNAVREYVESGGFAKVLWTGPLSVVSTPTSLGGGEAFSDWSRIEVHFSTTSDSDTANKEPHTISIGLGFSNKIIVHGGTGDMRFEQLTDTTFQLGLKTVLAGNIQRIIGIKL